MTGINGKSPPPPTCIQAAMFDIHIRRLLWMYCLGPAGVTKSKQAGGKSTIANGYNCVSKDIKCCGAWDTTRRPKALDDTPFLEARGVERGSARRRRSSLKGNHRSVRSALELFQKQRCANLKRQGGRRITGFPLSSWPELYELNCVMGSHKAPASRLFAVVTVILGAN